MGDSKMGGFDRRMRRGGIRVLTAIGLFAAAPAAAEGVELTGTFPAPYREASLLGSLAIGRFSGTDGEALSHAIERTLARTGYFDILIGGRPGRRGNRADGMLSGVVTTGVEENRFTRTIKECVEREGGKRDGKCLKEADRDVSCTRRVVTVRADMRIVDGESGRVAYSSAKPMRDEISWCPGESPARTAETTISNLIDQIAGSVQADIEPRTERYFIRFRESTKGLSKPLAQRFKAAVRRTKRDTKGACAEWAAIDREAPNHPSVLFDLGLCAEARGEYDTALDFYTRAARVMGSDGMARTGIDRIRRLMSGRDDARERARRIG